RRSRGWSADADGGVHPMNIPLPEFALVVLVGASGSGKSTFAAKHFKSTEVLSSDWCRAAVSDDANDPAATKAACELLHYLAAASLDRQEKREGSVRHHRRCSRLLRRTGSASWAFGLSGTAPRRRRSRDQRHAARGAARCVPWRSRGPRPERARRPSIGHGHGREWRRVLRSR